MQYSVYKNIDFSQNLNMNILQFTFEKSLSLKFVHLWNITNMDVALNIGDLF